MWEFILCRSKTVLDKTGLVFACHGLPKANSSVHFQQKIICTTIGNFFKFFFPAIYISYRNKYFSKVRWDSLGGFNNILNWCWGSIRELDLVFFPNHQPSLTYHMKMRICKLSSCVTKGTSSGVLVQNTLHCFQLGFLDDLGLLYLSLMAHHL